MQIITESGQTLVGQDVGNNDNVDSDADPMTGLTDPITLVGGCSVNETIYFGIE